MDRFAGRSCTGTLASSRRQACAQYALHWQTLNKILDHVEPSGYGARSTTTPSGDGGGRTQEVVPQKYNHKTELTLTVPAEGTTEANFELSSTPPKR